MQDVTTIQENTPEGTPVGQPVRATDADEGADINISIDWDDTKAYLQNNVVNPSIVKECVTWTCVVFVENITYDKYQFKIPDNLRKTISFLPTIITSCHPFSVGSKY